MGIVCDALTTRTNDDIATTTIYWRIYDGFQKDITDKNRRFSEIIIGNTFQEQNILDFLFWNAKGVVRIASKDDPDVGMKTTYGEEWFVLAYFMKSINSTRNYGILNIYVRKWENRFEVVFYNVYDFKTGLGANYKNNMEKECFIYDYDNFVGGTEKSKLYHYNYQKNNKFGFMVKLPCKYTEYINRMSDNGKIESYSYNHPEYMVDIDLYPKGTIFVPDGKDKITAISAWVRAYIDIFDHTKFD